MALIRVLRVPESNATRPPREKPSTPMKSGSTPGRVASQSAAFATSSGCWVPQSSHPLEGGHPRKESASATYPCSERRRAVLSTRGAPGTPHWAHPCNTMIAGSGFDVLAGRNRIPPRVTPEPGRLTSYRPGEPTLAMSVTGDVHPITERITSSIATVLCIDCESYSRQCIRGIEKSIKDRFDSCAQAGG